MDQSKLIFVDGIPGSGKSTTGEWIATRLSTLGVTNHFCHEMANDHPLRIYGRAFESLATPDEADWFTTKVTDLFQSFVSRHRDRNKVAIVDAYL